MTTSTVLHAELVHDANAALGEGPAWHADEDCLVWVDIWSGVVHRWDPVTCVDSSWPFPQQVGMAVPRRGGGLIVGVENGLESLDMRTGTREVLALRPGVTAGTRLNDGKCDPAGRLWVGSMGLDAGVGKGVLYRCDGSGMAPILADLTISNGMAWSADARTLYFIDTPLQRVDAFAFDADAGAISHRRVAFDIPREHGSPDGMCIDEEGCLWIAFWGGWAVRRYSPTGEELARIDLPVSLVTSCAFGGRDLKDLYITTARRDVPVDELSREPHAGGLFRVRTEIAGTPAVPFAG